MEKQFSGNRRVAVAWEPHSLVPGFGLDQLRITASYALERSQDLVLWEPTGQTYEGGLDLPDKLLRFEADSDVKSSYYRVVQTGIDLEGAVFSDQSLVGANLAGANLQGANLSFADLSGADLRGANLSGTNLTGADLRSALLANAILTGTILDGANLIGVSLEDVQVDGVDLSGALELPPID
ncbi:MAG: pentapeptide repeat-containing protein, partial [Verrucomicrobiales bacterium]|nr:pentapeptide repeat-containing protein [Verrucomicrobiales bacterium]